jgi:hypothetical protein
VTAGVVDQLEPVDVDVAEHMRTIGIPLGIGGDRGQAPLEFPAVQQPGEHVALFEKDQMLFVTLVLREVLDHDEEMGLLVEAHRIDPQPDRKLLAAFAPAPGLAHYRGCLLGALLAQQGGGAFGREEIRQQLEHVGVQHVLGQTAEHHLRCGIEELDPSLQVGQYDAVGGGGKDGL